MATADDSSPLVPPPVPSQIDLEAGPDDQIQCRICLESDGRDFIAPCKCKGMAKFGHRECLDHWRAIKEGFAFAHCMTCKAPYHSCCRLCADCHFPGTLCMWTDCTTCFESCASAAGEYGCLGSAGEAGLPLLFIMALIVLISFTVVGIFYSVLVATMVGQRIRQRHYHILAKRMLTKEYVVEDVDSEITGSD